MDIEELTKKLNEYELEEALKNQSDRKICDVKGYVKEKVKCILEFEGIESCFRHRRVFRGIDISTELSKIESKEIEHAIILAINGAVLNSICVTGDINHIDPESYFIPTSKGQSAIEFINYWKDKGAYICNYHNHPLRISAQPSIKDIDSFQNNTENSFKDSISWNKQVTEYGIDLPNDFVYDDWGVVTEFDFFSYQELLNEGKSISDIRKQIEKNQDLADIRLSKYCEEGSCEIRKLLAELDKINE